MASIRVKEPVLDELDKVPDEPTPEAVPAESVEETQEEISSQVPQSNFKKNLTPKKFIGIGLAMVILAMFISTVREKSELKDQVNKLSQAQNQPKEAQDAAEAENLKKEVGAFLELPADEQPTVATVVDASKVKNQSFFANAQNGDKVLLFPKAGKAVLYRQSTKKIIEVAPINLNNNQPATPAAPESPPPNRR